ncbi:MAG TPA: hypothetical protein VII64_06265 [Thermodesulfobacteriota bacterium]
MRGIAQKTIALIVNAHELLEAEHPMTLRQLFYRLVSIRGLQNSRADYQKLSRVMTQAREAGDINHEWLVDRSKPEIVPSVWRDPAGYLEAVARSYRRDYWQDQPYYAELWLEKDSLTGSVEGLVGELGITLRAHRGYSSTTKKLEIARLFDSKKKPIRIFYIGDHDPSGLDIERDLLDKISKYQRTDNYATIERLGILREDIALFNLPPLQIKDSDSRAPKFRLQHGAEVVEADALPPVELRARIREKVEALIDFTSWNHKLIAERAEFASIKKFAATFRGV